RVGSRSGRGGRRRWTQRSSSRRRTRCSGTTGNSGPPWCGRARETPRRSTPGTTLSSGPCGARRRDTWNAQKCSRAPRSPAPSAPCTISPARSAPCTIRFWIRGSCGRAPRFSRRRSARSSTGSGVISLGTV
ncbi:hypothetical protein T484DRAFT_1878980, partial [Baffinella frigidus]